MKQRLDGVVLRFAALKTSEPLTVTTALREPARVLARRRVSCARGLPLDEPSSGGPSKRETKTAPFFEPCTQGL
ncbi:hypothetical protein MRX96_001207 [Rhipicephalus microplus]